MRPTGNEGINGGWLMDQGFEASAPSGYLLDRSSSKIGKAQRWRRDRCVRTRARSRLGRLDQPAWPRDATGERHSPRTANKNALENCVQWP